MKLPRPVICDIVANDFVIPIGPNQSSKKAAGNTLLNRFLTEHVRVRFGGKTARKESKQNVVSYDAYGDIIEEASLPKEDIVEKQINYLSEVEREIITLKFIKLQNILKKEINILVDLNTDIEGKQQIARQVLEFIEQKLENAFIDYRSEYDLMDEQQVDELWRMPLLELLLVGSLNTFKNNSSVFSIVDELFQLVADKKDDLNVFQDISTTTMPSPQPTKQPTKPIYVSPKFEKESWGWKIEEEDLSKSKKD